MASASAKDNEFDRWLGSLLSRIRWITLAALLLLALIEPLAGRFGWPTWLLILCFSCYNVLVEIVHNRYPGLRFFANVAVLDLPIVVLLYSLGAVPGGALYVLVLLIVSCAASSMSTRAGLIYVGIAVVATGLIAPNLLAWSSTASDIRELLARLIVIVLVGVSTSMLVRRLKQERSIAQTSSDAAQELGELDRLRTGFVAAVSHDLRTPLTAMHAGLGLLEVQITMRLNSEERRLLSSIRSSTEQLGLLIDDLLTVNQLQAGVLNLERELLDLRVVITGVVDTMYPLFAERQQTLDIDLPEPLLLDGDVQRLEQVVTNVLGNAQRHTPSGTRIALAATTVDDTIHVTIHDDGPGIPPDKLQTIFERYHRSGDQEGLGLGLSIARSIVELHGGQIWAEGGLSSGTTFHIVFPSVHEEA